MTIKKGKTKKILKVLVSIIFVTALLFSAFFIYTADYYHAEYESVEVFATASPVTIETVDDNTMIFSAPGAKTGLIFYPGW